MRRAWAYATLTTAALGLALAGCASGGGAAQPTPTPTPTPAAACPAGDWRSSGVSASAATGGATLALQGGSGVSLTVGADGAVQADFAGMQPIAFTGQVAGAQVTGELVYQGPTSGTVRLDGAGATASPEAPAGPDATATPGTTGPATTGTPTPGGATSTPAAGAGASGPWSPSGPVTWGDLRITVRLTAPVNVTIVDNVKVSDVTRDQTTQAGDAVDLQPLLREGQYRCEGENLIITLSGGPGITWTFARA
jgi:hypothetical protein